MICPYNLKSETQIQQWQQEPDDNQTHTDGTTVTRTVYEYMECKQSECGTWHNGKCCYNKGGD